MSSGASPRDPELGKLLLDELRRHDAADELQVFAGRGRKVGGDRLQFTIADDGGKKILSCLDPKTGKVVWSGELGGKAKFESSPTVADDKVYCINFWGEVYVAKANCDQFELLSMNEMGNGSKPNGNAESVRASISVSASSLFVRTQDKLYRIAK